MSRLKCLFPVVFDLCLLEAQNVDVVMFVVCAESLSFWCGGQAADVPCTDGKLPGGRLCSDVPGAWSRSHARGRHSC